MIASTPQNRSTEFLAAGNGVTVDSNAFNNA